MSREPVVSASVAGIGYSPMLGILEVVFIQGGTYEYAGVPTDVHQALMAAPSKGEHVNRYIRGRFPFRRVTAGLP
jgi:hypothetical protein